VRDLCKRFLEDYSRPRNKPSTVETNQKYVDRHIIPILGSIKVNDVTHADIAKLMKRLDYKPVGANCVLACLRKMFNMAEIWGYRADGSNPCRHVPKYPESAGRTRLRRRTGLAIRLFGPSGRRRSRTSVPNAWDSAPFSIRSPHVRDCQSRMVLGRYRHTQGHLAGQ
jgi:Phage integrase, N-terminal SAM-like domain